MSDTSSDRGSARSRKFIPEVKSLEKRALLSSTHSLALSDPHSIGIYTAGRAVQTGTVLSMTCDTLHSTTLQLTDDGPTEDVTAAWNGGPTHAFRGVTKTICVAEKATQDRWTFDLTPNTTIGSASSGGGAGKLVVESSRSRASQASLAGTGGPSNGQTGPSTGSAGTEHRTGARTNSFNFGVTQDGSELIAVVNFPRTNVLNLTNEGGGVVQMKYDSVVRQDFTGVQTVVVDATNARRFEVTLTDV
jgi:hypothetical protein